jgi:virulence factor Mce-like protein
MSIGATAPRRWRRQLAALIVCAAVGSASCGFQGVNSLPLPGVKGRGAQATTYYVEFANIGTLESNSPVMIADVVVGSVGRMTFSNWHVKVEVAIEPGITVPANAGARIGQTSLLGSTHVALSPLLDQEPEGHLAPGSTIPLDKSWIFPSTEQTLSSLSVVVNGGGLGQIGDIVENFNAALSGRQSDIRDLLDRLDRFVGALDEQRDNIIESIHALNRLAGTFADQRDVISRVLQDVPPALDVLIRERPQIVTALDKLRVFSDTTTKLVDDTQDDIVENLNTLAPTLGALADVGDGLDRALAYTTVFPYGQNLIDRGVRGDYMNLFETLDFTVARLKNTTLLGTRWGDPTASLVPAPGEPFYLNYTYNPLMVGVAPGESAPPPGPTESVSDSALPPSPQGQPETVVAPTPGAEPPMIFAGPYGPRSTPADSAGGR